jgi:hypothetical protein
MLDRIAHPVATDEAVSSHSIDPADLGISAELRRPAPM